MTEIFIHVLMGAGLLATLLGLFIIFHIVRPQHHPADSSNRINKIRLIWFVLTREELFVGLFPWLGRDELENVTPSVTGESQHTTLSQESDESHR